MLKEEKKINLAMMIEDKVSFGGKPVHFLLSEVSGLRDSVLQFRRFADSEQIIIHIELTRRETRAFQKCRRFAL